MIYPKGTKVRVVKFGDDPDDTGHWHYTRLDGILCYLVTDLRSTDTYTKIKPVSGGEMTELYAWRIEVVGVEHESTEI